METTAVTIGTFDGVHAGHRFLLDRLSETAHEHQLKPLAMVLTPHPLQIVAPERAPKLLMTAEERYHTIRNIHPEIEVQVITFDERLRRFTHVEFMQMLKQRYNARLLLLGHDNSFGSDRNATPTDYDETGKKLNIEVIRCPAIPAVSSSIVRKLVITGDVEEARGKLCAPYRLTGIVGHGNALGRTIGFPTANLTSYDSHKIVPKNGVYAGFAMVSSKKYPIIVNIGINPTVGGCDSDPKRIEAHLIGYKGNLYDRQLTLEFYTRLRDEKRFSSLEELRCQIMKDLDKAKSLLCSDKLTS